MFSQYILPENSTKRFFAQPRGHKGTKELMRIIRRHTLEAVFQVMGVVRYCTWQKQLKEEKILYLMITLARPLIFDRVQPEMLAIAFPGLPVGITKSKSLLLFAQPDKIFFEKSTNVK